MLLPRGVGRTLSLTLFCISASVAPAMRWTAASMPRNNVVRCVSWGAYENIAGEWYSYSLPDVESKVRGISVSVSWSTWLLFSSLGFSWQASQVPLGRMLPFCSSYGTRIACWGGFNSQKAEVLTDVAIFWTGLHRITVSQSLRLQGEDVDSVSEWADLEPAWRRGEENNKRCIMDPYHACG